MSKPKGGFRALQVRADEPTLAWLEGLDARTKEGRSLQKSYGHALDLVAANFLHGEVIPVPRDARFDGVTNLRCENLAGSHRLRYTNVRVEEGTIALTLCIVTHREYDKLFRVRKK